jgi:hypothetical protein
MYRGKRVKGRRKEYKGEGRKKETTKKGKGKGNGKEKEGSAGEIVTTAAPDSTEGGQPREEKENVTGEGEEKCDSETDLSC